MRMLAVIAVSCLLAGCGSKTPEQPVGFEERQKQLFYEIDHQAVYEGCQELMRLHRQGGLPANTFHCDDASTKLEQLPRAIRDLRPTSLRVDDIMVTVHFLSAEGKVQSLSCTSDEFGTPAPPTEGGPAGLGFCRDPFGMDRLTGKESLSELNEKYDHFHVNLIPGLRYQVPPPDEPEQTLADVKRSNEQMDSMLAFMQQTMRELVVKKRRLLYEVDHENLLAACREMVLQYKNEAFREAKINFVSAELGGSPDDVEQIPQIVRDLEPVYVWFRGDMVMVALIGGLDHAGVTAYVDSNDAVIGDDDMLLIDGLVYYDDGLREVGEEYRDYLKSLEREAVTYLDWKRKKMNLAIPERRE